VGHGAVALARAASKGAACLAAGCAPARQRGFGSGWAPGADGALDALTLWAPGGPGEEGAGGRFLQEDGYARHVALCRGDAPPPRGAFVLVPPAPALQD
jgi:hypothetical protein